MLGKPKDQPVTNSILVLDVRNVSSPVFSNTFPLSNGSSNSTNQLSKGAIAGIAVGAIIAVNT
jgi:hypothetical protein